MLDVILFTIALFGAIYFIRTAFFGKRIETLEKQERQEKAKFDLSGNAKLSMYENGDSGVASYVFAPEFRIYRFYEFTTIVSLLVEDHIIEDFEKVLKIIKDIKGREQDFKFINEKANIKELSTDYGSAFLDNDHNFFDGSIAYRVDYNTENDHRVVFIVLNNNSVDQ